LKQKTATEQTQPEKNQPEPVVLAGEENSMFSSFAASLSEIRKLKGVVGYILRSSTSAIVDLQDQNKIVDYAVLSSQIHLASAEYVQQLNLGEAESTLVEGKNMKVLCMCLGGNLISVFMEKSATHAWIIKRILL
jgi:predicted regulator of Ras-like GTPase activity (Roadblock/LC7/MglB family)